MIPHPTKMARGPFSGLVVIFVLWSLISAPGCFAADVMDALRAFQENRLPGSHEIKSAYFNFTYRPFKRKDLTFNLVMPNGWRDIPLTVPTEMLQQDTRRMIPVAEQRTPDKDKSDAGIQVAYTRMDMEMSLYDMVDTFLKQNKAELLLRRQGTYNRRQVDEALIRSGWGGPKSFLSRLTFSRHGDRVFLVSGSASASEFPLYAQNFAVAAVSFTVHQKAPSPYAVPMADFTSAGTPRFRFTYPKEWEIQAHPPVQTGRTGVDMRLVVRDESTQSATTYGFIRVEGFSAGAGKTPDQILANLKEEFQKLPFSLDQCTLKADLMPKQPLPMGRLEKWNVTAKGVPGQVAFLILPKGPDCFAMALFCMRPKDNRVSWLHVWRVFEIIANDLTGKSLAVDRMKYLFLPPDNELMQMAVASMDDFAGAALNQDFHAFYDRLSTTAKLKTTPGGLRQAFKGFEKRKEMALLNQLEPTLEKETCIDKGGLLKLEGQYPTRPQATTFRLTYVNEQAAWKLMGINVAMKNVP